MKGIDRTAVLATLVALAVAACSPAGDRSDGWADDETTVHSERASPEVRAQIASMRSDVESILNDFRAELDGLRDQMQGEPNERLTQASARVEETRGEVLSDMEQLETADVDEARRIRDRASARLAELEGDVARSELEASHDAQTLTQRVEQRLADLESDLTDLERAAVLQNRDDEDSGWFNDDEQVERDRRATEVSQAERVRAQQYRHSPDTDEVDSLREELAEVREEAARFPAQARDGDDFESLRDDLSGRIADLTQDIKKHWYALKWTG
jgi:hypothetical protein